MKGKAKKAAAAVTIAAKGLRSTLHHFKERNATHRKGLFTRMDYDPAYLDDSKEQK